MTSLIPLPTSLRLGEGVFVLSADSRIEADTPFAPVAKLFAEELRRSTGWDLLSAVGAARIELRMVAELPNEAYRLRVSRERISIEASGPAGAFYGTRTLLQLFPSAILGKQAEVRVWSASAVEIEDSPRFSWRGSHLDVSRHFFNKAFVLRYIDLLALHKLNVLHLHLTDDQGWRMEVRKYPRLTEVGGRRADTMLNYDPEVYTGEPHEGFFTQADLREIVRYAQDRFVTVVPEIEMPGHVVAALAAYPELGNGTPVEVTPKWGVHETVVNVKDSTLQFFRDVLDEAMEIFPSRFIHIGGDECPKEEWKRSEDAQARIRELGLADEHELQSWFIRQMDAYLESKGRRLIGWSEILEGGLAPGAALMVWLGTEGAVQALKSGHDVVMAQSSHLYFDHVQFADEEKPAAWLPVKTLQTVYGYNPIPPDVTPDEALRVLGIQYQLWTEYIRSEDRLDYQAFPRACAAAELAWTKPDRQNFADFERRLPGHLERLRVLGVKHAPFHPVS